MSAKWSELVKSGVDFVFAISNMRDFINCPNLPCVAFIGASNVGKSTLINTLCANKKLARSSKTPGRTQQINIFRLANNLILADLPGYGYAKCSKKQMFLLQDLILLFISSFERLKLLNILLDIRRGIKILDIEIMQRALHENVKFQIILTKSDKVHKQQVPILKDKIRSHVSSIFDIQVPIIEVSSVTKIGISDCGNSIFQICH